jgi:hypothetical protein
MSDAHTNDIIPTIDAKSGPEACDDTPLLEKGVE